MGGSFDIFIGYNFIPVAIVPYFPQSWKNFFRLVGIFPCAPRSALFLPLCRYVRELPVLLVVAVRVHGYQVQDLENCLHTVASHTGFLPYAVVRSSNAFGCVCHIGICLP